MAKRKPVLTRFWLEAAAFLLSQFDALNAGRKLKKKKKFSLSFRKDELEDNLIFYFRNFFFFFSPRPSE